MYSCALYFRLGSCMPLYLRAACQAGLEDTRPHQAWMLGNPSNALTPESSMYCKGKYQAGLCLQQLAITYATWQPKRGLCSLYIASGTLLLPYIQLAVPLPPCPPSLTCV